MEFFGEIVRTGVMMGIEKGIEWASTTQSEPSKTPPDEIRLEEFGGLIISSAASLRLPKGSKPAQINHRLVWHKPKGQSITRTFCWTMEVDHKKIFYYWPYSTTKAIQLHIEKDLKEGLYDILKIKLSFCRDALDLWKFLRDETYANTKDGTKEKLTSCIDTLQKLLDDPQIKPLLDSSKEPPAQIEDNAVEVEKDKKVPVILAAPIPNSQEGVEQRPEDKIDKEIAIDETVAKTKTQINPQLNEKQMGAGDRITTLWRDINYLRTLKGYFDDADSVPIAEREISKLFQTSISNIFESLAHQDNKYDIILQDRKNI